MTAAAFNPRRTRHCKAVQERFAVRALARGQRIEIWLFRGERPFRRHASVSKALLFDASRYGESLLDEAIDNALLTMGRRRSRAGRRWS